MSQIVLAYILTESQLEEYARLAGTEIDLGMPDETTEVQPFFGFSAPVMVALEVMLEEHFDDDLRFSSEHVQSVREAEVPLLLAFHVSNHDRVVSILEEFSASPDQLAAFYEEFYGESWDEAGAAMLEAIRFVRAGVERLDETNCWFLLFIS